VQVWQTSTYSATGRLGEEKKKEEEEEEEEETTG